MTTPTQGEHAQPDAPYLQLAELLASGQHLVSVERKEAANAIRTLHAQVAALTQGAAERAVPADALRARLTRIHAACCSLQPKQAVGEMIAAMLDMPEWSMLAASPAQPAPETAPAQDGPEALSEFQEGQWWIRELDALASHPTTQTIRVTPDMKRAVAVVHNLLRAARAPVASKPIGWVHPEWQAEQGQGRIYGHNPDKYRAVFTAPQPPAPAATADALDAKRLDWLDQNIFHREMGEWDATHGGLGNHNMWVLFAPKGHAGTARNIIDAALAAQQKDTP